MPQTGIFSLPLISTIVAIAMALLVLSIRMRASNKPTSLRKIIIPPLGMSTGYLMFLAPQMRVPWSYALIAICVGLLFSYPLIWTSHMEIRAGEIYLRRSRSFIFILLGLLVLRLALHNVVEQYISIEQTGAVFFILAFFMILPWRIAMLSRYRKVHQQLAV
ncbi:MAG: hypothetical protein JWN30_433 [Bacilli bacterium]|nr:hypothetical protein [Bacilli bacterium]